MAVGDVALVCLLFVLSGKSAEGKSVSLYVKINSIYFTGNVLLRTSYDRILQVQRNLFCFPDSLSLILGVISAKWRCDCVSRGECYLRVHDNRWIAVVEDK